LVTTDRSVTTVRVCGDLDGETWPSLSAALHDCAEAETVVVDLRAVTFVSVAVGCELYRTIRALRRAPTSVSVMASDVLIRLVGLLITVRALPAEAMTMLGCASPRRAPASWAVHGE